MTRRTEGDWAAITNGDAGMFRFTIVSPAGKVVAQVNAQRFEDHVKAENDPEAQANARLMSAAPKLLRCLRETVRQLRNSSVAWADPIREAEDAIAEAEGK